MLSEQDKQRILKMTREDEELTFNVIADLFSYRMKKNKDGKLVRVPPKVDITEEVLLKKGEMFNDKDIKTRVGNIILNKILIQPRLSHIVGYRNEEFNQGNVNKLNQEIANALLEDKIKQEDYVKFMDDFQWISFKFHPVVSGSFTAATLIPDARVIKERDKLLKENKEAVDNGDSITVANIEEHLLKMADNDLKGDSGMNLYTSGARGRFGNNYKSISIMKGPILNPQTNKMEVVTQSFIEGIRKEDIYKMGNSVVTGAYPKAVGTADAGYFTKQIIALMQSVQLDPKEGSDCGSLNALRTKISKGQEKDYMYRYIKEGGKLIELTPENIHKYIGKEIKMRSPMYCLTTKEGKLCNKCAGNLYYKLKIYNLGLTASRASGTVLNLGMKAFHDSSAKTERIDHKHLTI